MIVPGENILVIEDDELLALAVKAKLTGRGFRVRIADNGSSGRAMFATDPPDLLILDLTLPDEDGLELCRDLRSASEVPILILSGRAEVADRVVGLAVGADDYVTKPCSLAELVERTNVLIRRSPLRSLPRREQDDRLERGELVLDRRSREVALGGAPVALTPMQYRILECLMAEPGRALSNDEIVQTVWGTPLRDPKPLVVHITNLRAKLAHAGGEPSVIRNVRSYGYRLESAVSYRGTALADRQADRRSPT